MAVANPLFLCLTGTVCEYLAPCCRFFSQRQRNCYHMQQSTKENSILKSITGPCISRASSLLSVNDAAGLCQIWCRFYLRTFAGTKLKYSEAQAYCSTGQSPRNTLATVLQAAAKIYLHRLVSLNTAFLSRGIHP